MRHASNNMRKCGTDPFMKHRDSVKMVTFWGVNDANSWRAQGKPLLFDGNSQPKPAFKSVIRVATGAPQKDAR